MNMGSGEEWTNAHEKIEKLNTYIKTPRLGLYFEFLINGYNFTFSYAHDGCLPKNASHFSSLKKKEFHKNVSQDLGALRESRAEKNRFLSLHSQCDFLMNSIDC